MTEKAVIKNIKKYNDIRLAKGICLDKIPTLDRRGNVGLSTQQFGHSWYMLPKGRAIFKTFDDTDKFFDRLKNMRLVNELVCYELAKQMNLPCAEYEPASKGKAKGLVTYDVATPQEKIYNLYQFYDFIDYNCSSISISTFSKILDDLQQQGYKLDKQKMLKTYFKVVVFDLLTAQSDRHENNLILLMDKKNKKIRFSPIIDNEFAFSIIYLDDMLKEGPVIYPNNFLAQLKEISCMLPLKQYDYNRDIDWYNSNLKELIKVIKTNDEYAQIFKDMCKNMDISKAIQSVEKKGIKINKFYKKYLIFAEKTLKNNIKLKLNANIKADNSYNFLNTKDDFSL